MSKYYIWKDKEAIPIVDVIEWATWFEKNERRVGFTEIRDVEVSTVFLGLDHSFGVIEEPLIFETMVFGGPLDQDQEHYSTWDQAEEGHKRMVEKVRQAI